MCSGPESQSVTRSLPRVRFDACLSLIHRVQRAGSGNKDVIVVISHVRALPVGARRFSGQSMVTVVHGVAYTSAASTLSTQRIITVAPENGARSAALKAAEA